MTDGKQNLTLRLEGDCIRDAKVVAARRGTSLSRLVAELIRRLVAEDRGYEVARERAERYLARGWSMGGAIAGDRAEWHDR